ncbi:MAG: hypothetical protein A3F31_04845 [Candidatus Levybacteria bacterium RIFCSPHIGHO2_12_FULL_38_12]|nr:MAG: hypothetical protein A2770_04530 [Candidatus Levybacteria bacterium RIFCSPHIGHO2_01_FULL_38_12]OGH21763.1 MAG: hypothetical protein A3D75_01060 [Candidatus Levybacteria bacterium RIFCSPHIGHO2_02_FULL_37_18]OGH22579.1 MAG: hypothetical protein A3F31_04845 [Candidatus Levybacteria bacterium RIFCSPHIGHO2_12_FULL_38_12]OGH33384.1 MAG: hypothetical protein A3A47_04010 [Candidatus Levybacteria bacterium RIFCSPLOWO2_01_FULL_37_20]OGH44117.1 MAG: hypothetical protein A3J14_05215 [Candidatus Lev
MRYGILVIIAYIGFIFSSWFLPFSALSSGDFPYLFLENIKEFSFIPDVHNLWLGLYYQIPTKILVQYFGIPWEFAERLLWFWPFLLVSIVSSYCLTRSWIGVLIYVTNTYILMVVGGGQMGVALAYALAPLVLKLFLDGREIVPFAISFGILTMFDPRIAYILVVAILAYIFVLKKITKLISLLFSILTSIAINSFWIFPFLTGKATIPLKNFDSLEGFRFYSFTDFSHTIALLHPNWPENLFGKAYFLQPEFIVIPIVAFASLLFLDKEQREKKIMLLYVSILGILGAFLAKGASEPFSFINTFAFTSIPGMSLFRDATKWYVLTVLSYSILIPYTVNSIQTWLNSKLQLKIQKIQLLPLLFIIFWIFTIRQAVFHRLGGTFVTHTVPKEYVELKDYLISQPDSFKTLWVPARQRYGFSSKKIEAISAENIFKTNDLDKILFSLNSGKGREIMNDNNIIFVIVPLDSQKELFITDRKYDEMKYQKSIDLLDSLSWLNQTRRFGKIAVFEVR